MRKLTGLMDSLFRTPEMPDKWLTAPTEETVGKFRAVFLLSDSGPEVLTRVLKDLSLFEPRLECEEDVIRHNAAIQILRCLGIWDERNAQAIVRALAGVPVRSITVEGTDGKG